jgi:hypothetical protein
VRSTRIVREKRFSDERPGGEVTTRFGYITDNVYDRASIALLPKGD